MARPPRIHEPGAFYHATMRGNHRQAIFREAGDRDLLDAIVGDAAERYDAEIHAYCWMTNHLHLLVRVADAPLGRLIHLVASRYARRFQRTIPTTGHLFERRYHARRIDSDSYLLEVIRYIHRNPQHAGIVRELDRYRWSSHRAYLGQPAPPWLTVGFGLGLFDPHPAKARELYLRFVHEDVEWDPADAEGLDADARERALPGSPSAQRFRPNLRLDALIAQACAQAQVSKWALVSPSRERHLSSLRAYIVREATRGNVATMAELAARLQRAPSTITRLLQRRAYGNNEA